MALLTRADLAKFQKCIEDRDYKSALTLAEKFGLDKDDVYKPQWSVSGFGVEAIRDVLSRVEDGMWVVKECKERVCSSFEAMSSLLSCGLRATEPFVYPDNADSALGSDKAWWFRFKRLRLLQYKDRLDTFVGINNGRYSQNEFAIFRSAPLHKVAFGFAERGKTGSLLLLFKRHTYSLAPYILQLLDAIPEPLPPHSYGQLLPDVTPPTPLIPRRSEDWVEKEEILQAVKSGKRGLYQGDNELALEESTEHMVKLSKGLVWPTSAEIIDWYKERAKEIDRICGLLENSLSLLDIGVGKGLSELETSFEDVSDLCGVVFSGDATDSEVSISLSDWEFLSTYQKFKLMVDGANEETVVERLKGRAAIYMTRNQNFTSSMNNMAVRKNGGAAGDDSESFLLRWLKETAKENKLSLCAAVLAESCREPRNSCFFSSDEELAEVALDCIYACSRTDEWPLMLSILAKLPGRESRAKDASMVSDDVQASRGLRKGFMKAFRGAVGGKTGDGQLAMAPLIGNVDETQPSSPRSSDNFGNPGLETLEGRLRQAEGHVEAGQLLSQYQVPKPISFFIACREDAKGTKQLLRILLLKFSNRDPAKSDNGWALLWRDLRILQEKAFPFLAKEYILSELCQGILKAGKFSLAKNYLKGTGTTILRSEKAEKLVLNAAREYFYSAPDLDSSSIYKARQCLHLLPPSKTLTEEINLIDAITDRLPALGVTLLPVQFRQLKDSMEVVKMAISSHSGAYLNIPEIMELARLLGLSSPDDVSSIEAAIAREAAAAGDFELARDICLGLIKKDHGPIWDLCAALARGPEIEQLDLNTRKKLIGFALSHSDEDFVGDLLSAWKEFDILSSCDSLGRVVGKSHVTLAEQERIVASLLEPPDSQHDCLSSNEHSQEDLWWHRGRDVLSVGENNKTSEENWESFAKEKTKSLGTFCLDLPWLLDLSSGKMPNKLGTETTAEEGWIEVGSQRYNCWKECQSLSAQGVALILYALATSDIVANDKLLVRLAQEAMRRPVSKEGDAVGCGYLLNLSNSHLGAEVLEKELERRENSEEAHQALELALFLSKLQESVLGLQSPLARRNVLIQALKEGKSVVSGIGSQLHSGSNFWSEFSIRAVDKLRVAEESRRLQQILPDVDVGCFISGNQDYIQDRILSQVDSVKIEKDWLPKILTLADQYNVQRWQVLERYFLALLAVDVASEEEIITELSGFWVKLPVSTDRLLDTLELYEGVASSALEGLQHEESAPDSEKKAVSRHKRMLVRALISLGSPAPPPGKGEEFLPSDVPEPSARDILSRVRHSVWQKLCQFAEDLQAPLHSRIFILELLEAIRNGKVPRKESWCSSQLGDTDLVISWGKWEAEGGNLECLKQKEAGGGEEKLNTGNPVNVLLALRSTQIISLHWPGFEITSADLSSPEAAATFFTGLVQVTSHDEHAKALKALLEEWESVLGPDQWHGGMSEDDKTVKGPEKEGWGGEDWGEGWEEFSENNWKIHTLHSCWKATLQKLIEMGDLREALGILDAALLHPTVVLITEEEALNLVASIGLLNPSAAVAVSLLLPYHAAQVHGLHLLEDKLKIAHEHSVPDETTQIVGSVELSCVNVNQELMALVLSSGLLPSTADDPSLAMVFSALCQFIGHLAVQTLELQLSRKPSLNECLVAVDRIPLCAVAFPFFVAELTKAKHYGHAGALVLQFMRVHPALTTWNAAYVALQRYLNTQADSAAVEAVARRWDDSLRNQGNCKQLYHLRNTVQSLTCRLEEVLKSATKALSRDMK